MKLQCTQCLEMTRLSKDEEGLLADGYLDRTAFICDDCATESNNDRLDMNDFSDADPGL